MSSYTLNVGAELVSLFFLSFSAFSDTNLKSMPGKWVMEVLLIFWPFQVRYEFEGERGRKRQTGCQEVFSWSTCQYLFPAQPCTEALLQNSPCLLPSPCWEMVWGFGKGTQESQEAEKLYLMLRMQQPHARRRVKLEETMKI